jgi:hypothetical protein
MRTIDADAHVFETGVAIIAETVGDTIIGKSAR